jgi:chemotaxis protein MotB
MAGLSRRAERNTNIWPGFVDALATLLMVIMFLLLVFVLAQFFLGQALSGRDEALVELESQVSELADLLSLERKDNKDLRLNLSQMSEELQVSVTLRDDLKTSVSDLRKRSKTAEDKILELAQGNESLQTNLSDAKDEISAQLMQLSGLNQDIEALKALKAELETEISNLAQNLSNRDERLAEQDKDISDLTNTLSERDSKITDLSDTIDEQKRNIDEAQRNIDKAKSSFLAEKELSKSARAEVALLNKQMSVLRQQLAKIQQSLDASEKKSAEQNVQITNLGKRLNAALASKVQELSRYRSEFFGRLRDMLGNREGIRIVGDRFVFQSEVLFSKGEASIGPAGKLQLDQLATTLLEIALEIPGEIDWILRVDGHTDSDPIRTARFPSNWELSSARAISVVKHLTETGLPANRLVAAGFGQYHPLDKRNDEIAKRRNRRIELKLTQR